MRLKGAVALVVGAGSAVGTAVVRGLLARDVAKVYADANALSKNAANSCGPTVDATATSRTRCIPIAQFSE